MKKDGFGNIFEEWTYLEFMKNPTVRNRALWREAKELNKFIENERDRT